MKNTCEVRKLIKNKDIDYAASLYDHVPCLPSSVCHYASRCRYQPHLRMAPVGFFFVACVDVVQLPMLPFT
jgi:hypothetical protein